MTDKIFGYEWSEIEAKQKKVGGVKIINTNRPGDYGADPIGDGTFRMLPSGDIVGWDERQRRLKD